MPETLVRIKDFVLDTLFPVRCLGCGERKEWLCEKCLSHIPLRTTQLCPACLTQITPTGEVCFVCYSGKAKRSLDGLFVAAHYKTKLLSQAIHTYKYRFVSAVAEPLSKLLLQALHHGELPLPDLIVPVPLHSKRLRYRGFNQAALPARILSADLVPTLTLPLLEGALLRTRFTLPQMKTENKKERLANLRDAFAVDPQMKSEIKGRSIWLIDDVATTGTTLELCARVLKKAGAKSVFGIVLAR